MKRKKPRVAKSPSSNVKGTFAQEVAATLYRATGLQAETHVFLPVRGEPERKREIDILLTMHVEEFEFQVAIECKNEGRNTTPDQIGAFIHKLDEVGLSVKNSVFISVKGFASGAQSAARARGIRTLKLTGIAGDQISGVVLDALQSIVFVSLFISSVETYPEFHPTKVTLSSTQPIFIKDGQSFGSVADFIWALWHTNRIEQKLGEQGFTLWFGEDSYVVWNGERIAMHPVRCVVLLRAHTHSVTGWVTSHTLVNTQSGVPERHQTSASFAQKPGRYVLETFDNEAVFAAHLGAGSESHIVIRQPLPRIYVGSVFWPPSARVVKLLRERAESSGGPASLHPEDVKFETLEGTDINAAWESPLNEYLQAILVRFGLDKDLRSGPTAEAEGSRP